MTSPSSRTTRYILIALALLALAVVVWRLSDVLVVAFGGIVVAGAFRAIADPLAKATGLTSRWSIVVVIVGLIILTVLAGWMFGSQAAEQVGELQRRVPEAVKKLEGSLQASQVGRDVVDSIKRAAADSQMLANVGLAATAFGRTVADLLLVLFLGVYFAFDPALYRDGLLRLVPPFSRLRVKRALNDAGESLRKWLLGQAVAMVSVGILVGVMLALLHVPLALSLGALAAVLEFVPVIGPILFAIPGVLIAFSQSPHLAAYTLLLYIFVQQVESNLITPLVQRWAVELAPAVGLLAVVAFGVLFGVMGFVFATPLVVVLTALVKHLYVEDTLEHRAPAIPAQASPRPPAAPAGRAA